MGSIARLDTESKRELLITLRDRFVRNMNRHRGMEWEKIEEKLRKNEGGLASLSKMESTGGEPDVIDYDEKADSYTYCDCSQESPPGRRSLCYDREALEGRKEAKPRNSCLDLAGELGIELLTEDQYRKLQSLGDFDTKTSSWLKTPHEIRVLGGAIFGDRRYGHVFIYHNGAESYYAARGFRGRICL